jgi:hypothetical protein
VQAGVGRLDGSGGVVVVEVEVRPPLTMKACTTVPFSATQSRYLPSEEMAISMWLLEKLVGGSTLKPHRSRVVSMSTPGNRSMS